MQIVAEIRMHRGEISLFKYLKHFKEYSTDKMPCKKCHMAKVSGQNAKLRCAKCGT